MQLNDEQKKMLHSFIENPKSLHIIIGTHGSGKTFLIKYIT
jgi:type II secretory ATPase GspE/PulE/Tfp pilus assembly ATPase PilB-like protein